MLWRDEPVEFPPTIQQLEEDPHATASRPVLVPGGSDCTDHELPSHWSRVPAAPPVAAGPGPTAQQADDDVQVTESRPPAVGGDAADQLVPFHWTINACGAGLVVLELSVPTAQQFDALVQVRAPRAVLSKGVVAKGTDPTDHEVPSHWRTKSCGVLDCQVPTTQQSLASAQSMAGVPLKRMVPLAGLGVVTCDHDEPSQSTVSTCWPAVGLSTFDSPTARQLLLEMHVTEVRSELDTPRPGNEACDHHAPSQWRATAVVTDADDVAPTAQQSPLDTQVTEDGSTETLGANMLPSEAKAQPGPEEVLTRAIGPSWRPGWDCGIADAT
jgi:hypothetical protein